MMNKKIWNLYKESESGKKTISLFTFNNPDNLEEKIKEIYSLYPQYLSEDNSDYFSSNVILFLENILADNLLLEENDNVSEYFENLIDNIEIGFVDENEKGELFKPQDEPSLIKQKDYKRLCACIPNISLALFILYPNTFLPILFFERFDVLMKTLDVLRISIPQIPASTDKRGRLLFYNDLCENIFDFATENDLTPAEICACIYDFGLILTEEDREESETELPEPTNIWLTGGSREDYKTFLKNPIKGAKSVWTCNENTKRGDIIVMYVLSPYSCIQSIWRAAIDGVYTPFNYYNSRTQVTNGITVPHISLNELKEDVYFSKLPIVRKNFQGVNGIQLSANDYNELKRLFTNKGFDCSILPNLYNPNLEISIIVEYEKDVEEKLLIPLLYKLGYKETDWERQLSQKAGRNEKMIPDFVFLPTGEIHFQNAPMVIEAKYDMSSGIEQTKAYNQALSYARMMKSHFFAICDKHRIILYKEKNGNFNRFNPIFEKHWQNLNNAEIFSKLKLLIGKENIIQK